MRVLHVYKTYYPDSVGGIEQVLLQLTRGLRARGVESRVFTLSPLAQPAVLQRPEGAVYRYPVTLDVASNTMSWPAVRGFAQQLAWADVVHYQFPWPFADLLHLLHRTQFKNKVSVVSYQSDVVRQRHLLKLYRPLMARFLAGVNAVVATSPGYIATSAVLQTLAKPVQLVPNGLDESTLLPVPSERLAHWRQRCGEGFFLFVGVLRYYKGLHTLVEAARGFAGQIVLAGEGPEQASLAAQIKALGLTNIKLLGHVDDADKRALLQLARAFVFPSHLRSEAFGMSLVEAAMLGKPMLSCEIGTGTSYVNEHGVTGIVVPPEDPAALRAAMHQLLHDLAAAARMGVAARQRYTRLFTGAHMAQAYHQIYQALLEGKKF